MRELREPPDPGGVREGGSSRGERGFALATALLALLLVSLALALLAASVTLHLRLAREEAEELRRVALCDAALAEALASLAADAGAPGVPDHPFAGGAIGSRIDPIGLGRYFIVVRGDLGGRRRAALAEAIRTPAGRVWVTRWRRLPGPG